MPTKHPTTASFLPLLLFALFALAGCGDQTTETPTPPPSAPADPGPTGPVVPSEGVEVVVVRSHEALPSLHAPEPGPMTPEEVYAAVQPLLISSTALAGRGDLLHCEVMPDGDRVRFWIKRGEGLEEEEAVTLAAELLDEFFASAEARFQSRVEVSLLGLGKELDMVSTQRAEAQQTLRDYLEVNRGVQETRETRREKAELERALSVINDRASALQDLVAELEALQEDGQPWYRRERR